MAMSRLRLIGGGLPVLVHQSRLAVSSSASASVNPYADATKQNSSQIHSRATVSISLPAATNSLSSRLNSSVAAWVSAYKVSRSDGCSPSMRSHSRSRIAFPPVDHVIREVRVVAHRPQERVSRYLPVCDRHGTSLSPRRVDAPIMHGTTDSDASHVRQTSHLPL